MRKQLMHMWQIQEQSEESQSYEELIPLPKNTLAQQALQITNKNEQMTGDANQGQLNLQQYLQIQRANTEPKQKKQYKKKLTPEQMQKKKQFEQNYGKGFKMLQGMGFNLGKGLGRQEQGRTNIVQAEFKTAFTTRNEDWKEPKSQKQDDENNKEIEKKQPQQQNIEQIFKYRSKNPRINTLFRSLKNSYQSLQIKLSIANRQFQSVERQIQFSNDFKVQKQNQVTQLNKEIVGLNEVKKDIFHVSKFPDLGLKYNLDLLAVKNTNDLIANIEFPGTKPSDYIRKVQVHLNRLFETLNEMYLEKQRITIRQYNNSQNIFQKFQKNRKMQNIESSCISLSEGDEKKIYKYIKVVIEESILKNKVQTHLKNKKTIQNCEIWLIDIFMMIKKFDRINPDKKNNNIEAGGQIITMLKQNYLIKLCNNYLKTATLINNKSAQKLLPHQILFPWFQIINIRQLDLSAFFFRIQSKMWSLYNDELYNMIAPWLQYAPNSYRNDFSCFYLAPRLLYEMEMFKIESNQNNIQQQKNMIKYFILYSKLLPIQLREQILKNSIAFQIYQKYQQFKNESNKKVSQSQIRSWVKRWSQKMNKIADSVVQRIFIEQGITNIF